MSQIDKPPSSHLPPFCYPVCLGEEALAERMATSQLDVILLVDEAEKWVAYRDVTGIVFVDESFPTGLPRHGCFERLSLMNLAGQDWLSVVDDQNRVVELVWRKQLMEDCRTPLCVPAIDGNEWIYVKDCLDTGWVSSNGAYVSRFEREIARFLGVSHAVATSSGTAALHLALLVAGVTADDEVLLPALTFIASANAVTYLNATPTFLDVDPLTWQLDLNRLEQFLSEACFTDSDGRLRNRATGRRISAVMPVHLLGQACDMKRLLKLASTYGLRVVEDSAEALGSLYRGKPVGTHGCVAALSFNGNKIITAGGGGMVVTSDADLANRARYLSTQARESPIEYIHHEVGFNYRMTNLAGAVGVAQLESLPLRVKAKRDIAKRYQAAFSGIAGLDWQRENDGDQSNCWLFTLLVDEAVLGLSSRQVMDELRAFGVEARPLFHPLPTLPPFRDCHSEPIPVSQRLYQQGLCLPCSADLEEARQTELVELLLRIFTRQR